MDNSDCLHSFHSTTTYLDHLCCLVIIIFSLLCGDVITLHWDVNHQSYWVASMGSHCTCTCSTQHNGHLLIMDLTCVITVFSSDRSFYPRRIFQMASKHASNENCTKYHILCRCIGNDRWIFVKLDILMLAA